MVFTESLWQITNLSHWRHHLKIICLTGGLASGKSTAVKFLAGKGAHIIDADLLGHQAYNPGTEAFEAVIAAFGEETRGEDGQINRKVLGGKVFGKPEELKKLTDIVWPEIRRLAELQIADLSANYPDSILVLEAAVLFEAGWEDMGDEIWVITVDRETAIDRSMKRDDATREAVESRLNSQLSNEERTSRADRVISNDGSEDELIEQLEAAWLTIAS
jgi:phosphopantetheine adenylyltransferase/dephospho-CoA kinase